MVPLLRWTLCAEAPPELDAYTLIFASSGISSTTKSDSSGMGYGLNSSDFTPKSAA